MKISRIIIETEPETKNEIKAAAAKKGMSIKEFVIEAALKKIKEEVAE